MPPMYTFPVVQSDLTTFDYSEIKSWLDRLLGDVPVMLDQDKAYHLSFDAIRGYITKITELDEEEGRATCTPAAFWISQLEASEHCMFDKEASDNITKAFAIFSNGFTQMAFIIAHDYKYSTRICQLTLSFMIQALNTLMDFLLRKPETVSVLKQVSIGSRLNDRVAEKIYDYFDKLPQFMRREPLCLLAIDILVNNWQVLEAFASFGEKETIYYKRFFKNYISEADDSSVSFDEKKKKEELKVLHEARKGVMTGILAIHDYV